MISLIFSNKSTIYSSPKNCKFVTNQQRNKEKKKIDWQSKLNPRFSSWAVKPRHGCLYFPQIVQSNLLISRSKNRENLIGRGRTLSFVRNPLNWGYEFSFNPFFKYASLSSPVRYKRLKFLIHLFRRVIPEEGK